MLCENIKIHLSIPVPQNSFGNHVCLTPPSYKDPNGIAYEIDAIKDACMDIDLGVDDLPIGIYLPNDEIKDIGKVTEIKYSSAGTIEVDGVLTYGGTEEFIASDSVKKNHVVSMDIDRIMIGG